MKKDDLAYSFRVAFDHKTQGKADELVQIDVLLGKLQALNIQPRNIAIASRTRRGNLTLLKLTLHIIRGGRPCRELYFNAKQELVFDQ